MSLFNQHKEILDKAIQANKERGFHAQYPEHPKAYGEDGAEKGLEKFNGMLDSNYEGLLQTGEYDHVGEEESPFWQKPLGIKYPAFKTNDLVSNANTAFNSWRNTSIDERAGILLESLERIKDRFFEIAYATMHTSGQSFMMSFQASGPHANDRALEAVAMAYEELNRFSSNVRWVKPMGKFSITLDKDYIPVPKGISLAIGCSTFPIWNTVPGVFASLATGNPVICKPHQGSILPIAIVVEEIQKECLRGIS
ncbi:MAG: aldehyde dehydrogenase family protein [Bacteroidetes bacterium]|nr:aldehyde dehydrogenase family protein [Bacteroidota bacterium]